MAMLQVLSCYAEMARGQEEDIDSALKQLLELAGLHRESVPVLLALASAFMLKKQIPKARCGSYASLTQTHMACFCIS